MKARNIKDHSSLKEYKNNILDFTEDEETKIKDCIEKYLKKIKNKYLLKIASNWH